MSLFYYEFNHIDIFQKASPEPPLTCYVLNGNRQIVFVDKLMCISLCLTSIVHILCPFDHGFHAFSIHDILYMVNIVT